MYCVCAFTLSAAQREGSWVLRGVAWDRVRSTGRMPWQKKGGKALDDAWVREQDERLTLGRRNLPAGSDPSGRRHGAPRPPPLAVPKEAVPVCKGDATPAEARLTRYRASEDRCLT